MWVKDRILNTKISTIIVVLGALSGLFLFGVAAHYLGQHVNDHFEVESCNTAESDCAIYWDNDGMHIECDVDGEKRKVLNFDDK